MKGAWKNFYRFSSEMFVFPFWKKSRYISSVTKSIDSLKPCDIDHGTIKAHITKRSHLIKSIYAPEGIASAHVWNLQRESILSYLATLRVKLGLIGGDGVHPVGDAPDKPFRFCRFRWRGNFEIIKGKLMGLRNFFSGRKNGGLHRKEAKLIESRIF